jgi:MOSC domain-containing protein YiiM
VPVHRRTTQAPRGSVERLAGVMAVVVSDGEIRPGDAIRVRLPAGPHRPLVCV